MTREDAYTSTKNDGSAEREPAEDELTKAHDANRISRDSGSDIGTSEIQGTNANAKENWEEQAENPAIKPKAAQESNAPD